MSGAPDLSSWSQADGQEAPAPDLSTFSKPVDLSTWANPTAASAPSQSTLGTLIRQPRATLGALADRFSDNVGHSGKHGVFGSVIDWASEPAIRRDAGGGVAGDAAVAARRDIQRSNAPRPATNLLEGAVDLTGGIVGAFADPTSYIAPSLKGVSFFKNPALNRIAGHAAGGALTGAALDTAQQGINLKRDQQDKYSPTQLLLATGLQGGLGGAGQAFNEFGALSRQIGEGIEPWVSGRMEAPEPRPAPKPAGAPAQNAATLQNLWGRLIKQESGGNQGAVSPKGAFGAAQLMPETAAEVATRIGRPDLAALAKENSPAGKQANEYLGQIYLGQQLQAFDGDPALALAAYNAGPGRVREWLSTIGHPDKVGRGNWLEAIPFDETRNYVRNILGDAAGGPGRMTADLAQARARLQTPAAPEPAQPNAAERAAATLDQGAPAGVVDTPNGPDLSTFAEPTAAEPAAAGPVSRELVQDLHDFPGDRPAGTGEIREDIPWDDPAPTAAAQPLPEMGPPNITDQALDHIRAGSRPKLSSEPSLLEMIVREGGMRDEGGELSRILGGGGEDRFLKKVRRVNAGRTINDIIELAHDRGYIGTPGSDVRPDPAELLEAIRREVAGDKVYPEHAFDHQAQMVADHIQDLDEILTHLGLDPKTHSNAEIRAAMDRMFADPEVTAEVLGMLRGGANAGAKEAVERVRTARQRMADREAILGLTDPATDGARLRGNRQAGDVAMPADGANLPPLEATFADIWRNLKTALDVPVRQGRITMRKALGTYNRKSGVVRVKGVHDVGVEAHELAHAMEFTKKYPTLLSVMAQHSKTLKGLDYDPKAARRHEGFAEFTRWYVVNPEFAKARAPLFYDAFELALASDDPKAFMALKQAQAHYDAFLKAPSLQSAAASIVRRRDISLANSFVNIVRDRGLKEGAGMLWRQAAEEVYRGIVDHLHPWKKAVEELRGVAARNGVDPKQLAAYDPYKLLRQLPAVYSAGHMDLIHGVHPYQGVDPEGPSLAEALELALGERFLDWDTSPDSLASQFDAYLIGRRVRHDYDRIGQEGGLDQPPDQYSKEYWERVVADAEARNPQWAEAAEMIYQWNDALLRKRRDAGLISEETYAEVTATNPDYVPLYRDLSDTKGAAGGPTGLAGGGKYAGGVKRRRGSTRGYMSPVESMMQHAYTLNAQIARNDALKALDDMGRVFGPDAGRVVERIPAKEVKPLRVGVQEVIDNAAREHGLSKLDQLMIRQTIDDLFGEDASSIVYRAEDARERSEPILYVWRDGERIPLRLPDGKWGQQMVEAFAGASPVMRGWLFELATLPARLVRVGTTAHPQFFIPNTIRDQVTATLLTDVNYRPFVDQARGITHELTQSDLTRRYNVVGGEIGGMQSAAERDGRLAADLNVLRRRGFRVRHFANWQAAARAVELSETGTRLGLFERGEGKFAKEGLGEWEAAKEAAFEARDYIDFDRHGGWPGVRAMMRLIPFFNAAVQSLDKVARVAGGAKHAPAVIDTLFRKGPPVTPEEQKAFDGALKLWIGMTALAVGSLALRAAYTDNPEFEELSDYVRNTGWAIPLPGGEFAVIPKPYTIVAPGNAFERLYEGITNADPTAWKRLLEGLETQVTPNHDAPILAIPFQLARNRDTFGSPIVPDQLQDVDPQFQYTDRTSGFSRKVGELTAGLPDGMKQSPAKLDFLIKSLFSSFGRDALSLTSPGKAPIERAGADTPVVSRFVKDWTRGANSTKEFYNLVSTNSGKWMAGVNSVNKLVNDGDVKEAVKYIAALPEQQRAYTIVQLLGDGADKALHPMTRAQKISTVLTSMAFDIQQGNLQVATPGGLQPVEVTPEQRRDAVDALRRMAVAEQRNAMIVAGVEGWKQRDPLAYDKYALALNRAHPALPTVMAQRMMLAAQDVGPATETYQTWKLVAPKLAALKPEQLQIALEAKRGKGRAGALRALEEVAPVR